ncbi:nuclear transport factor 2 family protein [Frankia gtarii]|uniref:nuclear transport factor 2 family protein n=1 Tax=Frankia gtarii TaxID=2950102 RepID=UPI0021BFCF00|nr:nuclear transport factor 2 family protein [Frankia gtarii]
MTNEEVRTRVGVADLLAKYQFLADSGKIRQLSALFTADAVFENNTGRHHGPAGVLEFFRDTKDSFIAADLLPARHYLSSIYVDPRPDDGASAYACFQFVGTRGLDHWGTYRDEIVESAGTWLFAGRKAIVEGCVPDSPVVALLGLASAGARS